MKPQPRNKPRRPSPFLYLILIALGLAVASVFWGGDGMNLLQAEKAKEVSLSEILQKYEADELLTVEIKDTKITAEDTEGVKYEAVKEIHATIQDLGLNNPEKEAKVSIIDTSTEKGIRNFFSGLLPLLLVIVIGFFIINMIAKKGGGGMGGDGPFGFGKSKAKVYQKGKNGVKFTDVAGAQEAKEETAEVVDFLKFPKKYLKMGAKIPKGILLVGPPGTGKTLLARAIAGEAGVPFFSVSGSEFVEMFVGVGASRVRDLFKTAKRNAPAIIFIDEIDAIGKRRGQGMGGGHDEREQTLNQILTEMDGFETGTNVIVMAATNRPDVLDKALLRPGRFDRRVHIDLPDMEARKQILDVHAKNKPMEKGADLEKIASKTVGFSGADIESLLNEAAISAVKNRKAKISHDMLEDAVEKISMGPERRSRRITDKERKIIAYHEVGHAIAGHYAAHNDPVHKITIISRGGALGVTWFLPQEDTYLRSEQQMKDQMVSLHGGRVAERLFFGETTSGASNDLERISAIARQMVMKYGMGDKSKIGPVVFSDSNKETRATKEYSEETARVIDEEVQKLVLEAEKRCEDTLKKHKKILEKIAEDLLERETIYRDEFLGYLGEKE